MVVLDDRRYSSAFPLPSYSTYQAVQYSLQYVLKVPETYMGNTFHVAFVSLHSLRVDVHPLMHVGP